MISKIICMKSKMPKGIKTIDFDTAGEELLWQYFKVCKFIYVYDDVKSIGQIPSTEELRALLKDFQKDVMQGEGMFI